MTPKPNHDVINRTTLGPAFERDRRPSITVRSPRPEDPGDCAAVCEHVAPESILV